MQHKLEMPKNKKEGLQNQAKMLVNALESGNVAEALNQAHDLVDRLASDELEVKSNW